jgi:hypothetical protein
LAAHLWGKIEVILTVLKAMNIEKLGMPLLRLYIIAQFALKL